MFPIEFDHRVLDSLPVPDDDDITRIVQILKAVVIRRVIPYLKKKKGTDPIASAGMVEHLSVERLEDADNRIRVVSFVTKKNNKYTIHIHERVFDYFVFVIPTDPESHLGTRSLEERKVFAFAELLLRHQAEHLLYPQNTEQEVIQSDIEFAMDRREDDPTYFRALRSALDDEMNGLIGAPYLTVIDCAEQGIPWESKCIELLDNFVQIVSEIPGSFLYKAFPEFDEELKTKIIGNCYARSKSPSSSLMARSSFLQKTLSLLIPAADSDIPEAENVFGKFKTAWGLYNLLTDIGIPVSGIDGKSTKDIFHLLRATLRQFHEEGDSFIPPVQPSPVERPAPKAVPVALKSLADRIEEARQDSRFPRQVLQVIDKNKLNAVGHSGSKFSELIETLLAVPWGKIERINVSAEDFEKGLNTTHYGLAKPKEIICDFFSNLIWRYNYFKDADVATWRRNGSAFLLVGPPGVGKTSLAISIAENLKIPYHKLSLGGMRDEADLKGHGFTYEGSKPGAILQGLIKMGIMNGMFIMDEADKTEKFAISTLLEILDPEQNHLFHDKYTETTVDVDLSNCHFMLTANTLETVPAPVINRCEVILLDRYSIEEKVCIAREHLIRRIRKQYRIDEEQVFFEEHEIEDLLRFLVKTYTHEAGVRELERIIRALFLRIFRKEILGKGLESVRITRDKIKDCLDQPRGPRKINPEDRIGEMLALGVNVEMGIGSIIPIQATRIEGEADGHSITSMIHATGNIQKVMDESRRVALTAICHEAETLGIDLSQLHFPIHLHFMGGSTSKDGPSAGGAIALALVSLMAGKRIRRDVAMTGEIDTQGRITAVGGLALKLETAFDAGCRCVIIPKENVFGEDGLERLSDALKQELHTLTYEEWKSDHAPFDYTRHVLQVIAVDNITQAMDISCIDDAEITRLEHFFDSHALDVAGAIVGISSTPGQCFNILYVKDPSELDTDLIKEAAEEHCKFVLLARAGSKEAILKLLPITEAPPHICEFDPFQDDLFRTLADIDASVQKDIGAGMRLSMLAPYFFLLKQGVCLEGCTPGPGVNGFRVFVNNYTSQGIKIKESKSLLNKVFKLLSPLSEELIKTCPFLISRDGVHLVDLSYIPEKYRIDTARAEHILNEGLKNWLTKVEAVNSRSKQ
ncbi:S16 family serine protease [Desulfomonile tiedjei]|uniref:endopeptidase La n=1 Tax=Desulfomonile tiedjei (strain ATCC 49306 / DSM 6799 / DCB-1) TaxID=706587 RepID=I4CBE6_DESTA|nr:S16 family serine protease [Desulfomonile tiedjei]AFM26887.1 ATP-dependent Lon protase [Desulfomonile tiedjei DSM 6799]